MPSLGEKIKEARASQGFEQKDFAKKLNISPAYLCRIERDERRCSVPMLRLIAKELAVPLFELADSDAVLDGRKTGLDEVLKLSIKEHPEVATYLRRLAGNTGALSEQDRKFLADHLNIALGQADSALKKMKKRPA